MANEQANRLPDGDKVPSDFDADESNNDIAQYGFEDHAGSGNGRFGILLQHARRYAGGHSPRYFVGLLCFLLCVVVLVLPSPYVIESPGPTQDVLGTSGGKPVISITGAPTSKGSGKLLLLTVNAEGVPGYPIVGVQALAAWFNPQSTLMPSEAVFPIGQTSQEYVRQSNSQMSGSQDAATTAALNYAKTLHIDVSKVKVNMHVDNIGGPSAGMMYTLGIIDELTPQDETGGKTIAGTGTISTAGKVGAIGGIRLKMLGAKRDGATWFLAPAANCSGVIGHVPSGLRDVKVSTIDEAYKAMVAIGKGQGGGLPHCTV